MSDEICAIDDENCDEPYRRIVARNLCKNHFEEMVDESPPYLQQWIDERAEQ